MFKPQYIYTDGIYVVLAGVVVALTWQGVEPPAVFPTSVLLVLAVLAQWNTTKWRQDLSISVHSILIMTAIAMLGPWGALAVGGLGTALSPVHWRRSVRIFNAGMHGLAAVVAAIAYHLVGGRLIDSTPHTPAWLLLHGLFPLTVAVAVLFSINMCLLAGMIAVTTPAGLLLTAGEMLLDMWLPYLGYGLVGFVIAVLWEPVGLGAATLVLMAVPLVLAQWSFREQTAELDTQQRTVEALVAAVEARDPVLRGRSARVAAVSIAMGEHLGLGEHDVEALRFAAWLHDVGLASPDRVVIGPVPSRPAMPVVGSPEHADELEFDRPRLLSHPERGVRMVEGIDFLAGSAPAILHHHERWDGRGYPSGLAGEQIPLLARVVAVAATACALADDADDPSEVVAGLRRCAGGQLDPGCVAAFEEVATALAMPAESDSAMQDPHPVRFDHDSPYASDLLAAILERQLGPVVADPARRS